MSKLPTAKQTEPLILRLIAPYGLLSQLTGLLLVLGIAAMVFLGYPDPKIHARVLQEIEAKKQAEIESSFNSITGAEWRIVSGEWSEEFGTHYIAKTNEKYWGVMLFRKLPAAVRIGDKIKLRRRPGASDPHDGASYFITRYDSIDERK